MWNFNKIKEYLREANIEKSNPELKDPNAKTSKRLMDFLKRTKFDSKKLAKEIGISEETIKSLMSGKGDPTIKVWSKLSDYFEVGIPWLSGEGDWDEEEEKEDWKIEHE